MAIMITVYDYDGEIYRDPMNLPTAGLRKLIHELEMLKARQGINFMDTYLLQDLKREYADREDT